MKTILRCFLGRFVILSVVVGAEACGGGGGAGGGGGGTGGGGDSGGPDKSNASFQLTVAPAVTVFAGVDVPIAVTVERAPGFADAIVLSSSAAAGIDAATVTVSGAMSGGALILSIAPAAKAGAALSLVVTGTGGALVASKRISVTIAPALPSAQATIAAARRAGTLDAGTALLYRAYALFGDARLPPAYAGSGSVPEDDDLLADLRAALPGLTPDLQALLVPFTLRPNDPASWYNDGVIVAVPAIAARPRATAPALPQTVSQAIAATPPPRSCAELAGQSGWASQRSASFPARAWAPCAGDAVYDAQSMQMLTETLAVIDKAWQPLGELMGDATGNPILDLDGADEAIDVYIDRGAGVRRAGGVNSAGSVGGRAFPDAPFAGTTSSAFVVIPELQFGSPRFHATIVHELFHVHQLAYSGLIVNALASSAAGVDPPSKYWFYEASATWAGAYFDWVLAPWTEPRGAYLVAYGRFAARFQPSHTSLNGDTEELHDYSAFIWPYFLEQSLGGPQVMGQIWKNLVGATASTAADDVIDAAYPFATHFREFALRNLNVGLLPGDPLPRAKRYIMRDPDFKDDGAEPPYSDTPGAKVTYDITDELVEEEFEVPLNPLSARYLRFPVTNKTVKHVSFDLSDFSGWSGLDVDALVKINGTWESAPRDLKGKPKLEFCLEKPEEKVEEVRFVLANHDRLPGHLIMTVMGLTATTTACGGTWAGTSSYENKPVLQSGGTPVPDPTGLVTKCSAEVTWVFDPEHSNEFVERYHPEGMVHFSRVDSLGTTYEYSPSSHVISPDLNNGLSIIPDPSGVGSDVAITGSTTFDATETITYAGAKPLTSQRLVTCLWFGGGNLTLGPGETVISGKIDTVFALGNFSFSKP